MFMLRTGVRSFTTSCVRSQQQSKESGKDMLTSLLEIYKQGASRGAGKFDSQQTSNLFPSKPRPTLLQEETIKRKTNSLENMAVPRTGVMAGRSVKVQGPNQLGIALAQLQRINMANKVPRTLSLQRYHERPGKTKRRLLIEKNQREFNMGIKRLFKLVAEARRKGY